MTHASIASRPPLPLLCVAALLGATCGRAAASPGVDTTWEPVKIGAGGFVTGIDVDAAGTTWVIRADTYGAYVGNGADPWRQVVTAASLPASLVRSFTQGTTQSLGEGVYEIRVAPSRPDRLYMIFRRAIWRSDDRGGTWAATSSSYVAGALDPNDATRYYGQKMAVDPANPDVVYAGSESGLWVTTDAGVAWSRVPGVPAPTDAAHVTGIAFDPGSGATGRRTRTIYATSNGRGVYRSTDAGATWARLPGGPTVASNAAVAKDGAYWVANRTNVLHRYSGGAWSRSRALQTGGQIVHAVATDPFDPARVVAGLESGLLAVSNDRGASWIGGGVLWSGGHATRVATDVPWLATANERYMGNASMVFDPRVRNKLWFAQGIGVWYSTDPDNPRRTTWRSHSAGIEQLTGRDVLAPPGSPFVFAAGLDRGVFRVPASSASYPAASVTMGSSANLVGAWAIDASRANPAHLVAIVNGQAGGDLSGYSLDGGATWTRFPVQPASGTSGSVAVPSIDDILVVIGTGYAWRSTDRGASWSALSLPGVSNTAAERQALHDGYVTKKHVLAVDGADRNTVYLYFFGHGIYRSSDGGATWELRAELPARTYGSGYWHAKLRSIPGRAGHLFFAPGITGGAGDPNPAETFLWRSIDGGSTWARVPGMREPYDVAVGKAAPGASCPAIYVVGWYRGEYGIWRSTDDTTTWTNIGPFPLDDVDEISVIKANQDVYGEVYVAFHGSGWARGRLRSPEGSRRP